MTSDGISINKISSAISNHANEIVLTKIYHSVVSGSSVGGYITIETHESLIKFLKGIFNSGDYNLCCFQFRGQQILGDLKCESDESVNFSVIIDNFDDHNEIMNLLVEHNIDYYEE